MNNLESINDFSNIPERRHPPLLVDYRDNAVLSVQDVAFHWWVNQPTSLHYHNFYEVFLITDGAAVHCLNGTVETLRLGTLRLIRPQDVHQFLPVAAEGCTHMNLLIRPEKMLSLSAALDCPQEKLNIDACLQACINDLDMRFFLDRAERINLSGHYSDAASRVILEMFSHALGILGRNIPDRMDSRPAWFIQLLRKLHTPEYLSSRAADVYTLSPYSPPVLIRCFREYEGCTVVEYLTRLRMQYARSLLTSTNFPIQAIAVRLGYDSLSHFCRVFRANTGKTPMQFRKEAP